VHEVCSTSNSENEAGYVGRSWRQSEALQISIWGGVNEAKQRAMNWQSI
jgi:hypothetical protein